jgi:PAS domain S-box-containing protein
MRHPEDATILMVDDRSENLVALEAILEPLGHRLIRAGSARDALREVLRNDVAVILMDVQMPEMNGFEAAAMIKSRKRSRDVPIIFLTAISKEEQYVFEGYSAGGVDYMSKPFHPEILRSKVSVFVDLFFHRLEIQRRGELLRASERRELELRYRAGLLESQARYGQIVDCAMDPIVSFGEDGRITLFNAAAERVFEVAAARAIGRPIQEFLKGMRVPDSDDASCGGDGPEPKNHGTTDGVGVRGDGEEFAAEYSLASLTSERERIHTLILRDISDRRRAEALLASRKAALADTLEELRAVNEQLEDRTRALESAITTRSRFYASMSHELRTPINAILGYTSLMLDGIFGEMNEDQRSSAERTFAAANHLMELVNDILDLSKVEAGKMELKLEPVVFPDLVLELFATVSPLAEETGVELAIEPGEETVVSDPRRVRQILLNLLSNAIKFGHGKPVRVACWRDERGDLVVEVRDQGPGISAEDQERIFEEFVQLEEQSVPGTGLGLPISRRLAELLGGSLSVVSAPGEGSSFRLTLPRSVPGSWDDSGSRNTLAELSG